MNIRINQNPTLRERIDIYYHNTHLSHPGGLESLLSLIAALDDLAIAFISENGQPENPDAIAALAALDLASDIAARVITPQKITTYVELPSEIAECLMFLDRFADACDQPEPTICLERKLTRKLNERKSL